MQLCVDYVSRHIVSPGCLHSAHGVVHIYYSVFYPPFVRFPRIVTLLLRQSICVTDAATVVGKLLVQSFRCQIACANKCKASIIKPLPSLHLRVCCKPCHLSKVCQLVQIPIRLKLLWCLSMFLSWHQESSYVFAVLPLRVGAISIWRSRWFGGKQVLTELTSQRTQFSD